ncbi:hypothetical protein GCM10027418_01090 [Mariniluteicoccus endophyticus]
MQQQPEPAYADPVRTCVGCRRKAAQGELVRLVVSGGEIVVDAFPRGPGRGAYLHPVAGCAETALKRRALQRALRTDAVPEAGLAERVATHAKSGDKG